MKNFSAYVSQKNWKDEDVLVECTVECYSDNILHKKIIVATDPLSAIDIAQKSNINSWNKIKENDNDGK